MQNVATARQAVTVNKNLHIISLGCPKARVDTELMLGLLRTQGWRLVAEPEEADAILVNSCAFLQSSIDESIDVILECAQHKQARCKRLVVAGCLPSRYEDEMNELKEALPEVDAFLTTKALGEILKAIQWEEKSPVIQGCLNDSFLARSLAAPQAYAYLKISEGCNRSCSFCIIPKIRGRQQSRTIGSLVQEARQLVDSGVKELVLVAQELTNYGSDIGLKDGLLQLLDGLETIDGLEWLRLMYTYPWNFTEPLIQRLGQGKVLSYVDIPLQHVSERILKDMRRHTTQAKQDALIRRLRDIPNMHIRTSLIAGYPSETEEEFEELCEWIKSIRFDRLGVFAYSAEPGTEAGDRKQQIPLRIRRARRDHLMQIQREIHAEKMEALIGKELKVLVDGPSEEHPLVLEGRYEGQAPEVDGKVFLSFESSQQDDIQVGRFVNVKVVEASDYDILGKVIDA